MVFQILRQIFSFFLKIVLWVVMAGAVIPYLIYILLLNIFTDFTQEADFWFWAAFIPLNIVAYYFLWKPIVWTINVITAFGEET